MTKKLYDLAAATLPMKSMGFAIANPIFIRLLTKRNIVKRITLLAASCVVIAILGCNPGESDRLPRAPVDVKVTYKGAPVENAVVTFLSMGVGAEAGRPPAFGRTGSDGTVKLGTYESSDGAVIGKHGVSIVKQEFTNQKAVADQDSPDYNPGASPVPQTKHLLPQKYAVAGTSGLTADVVKGPNSFTFELKDGK
jgi:hypothetical protein